MDPGPVKIFADSASPRLRYIAAFLLDDILGLPWELVTDRRKLGKSPVINYSDEEIKCSFHIKPAGLLSETGLREISTEISEWKGLPVFFPTPEKSDLPFDIFAASFFLLSRYEEYLSVKRDEHDRFCGRQSFSYKNGFLDKPVIDLWVKEWSRLLVLRFRNLVFRKNPLRKLVTIDVDEPFEYLGKDMLRNIGSLLKDFSSKSGKAAEHYRTLAKGEKDPWDVFDYIFEKLDNGTSDVKFFIPVGDRTARDNQPSWHNEEYRRLIVSISRKYAVGMHPSFDAAVNIRRLKEETDRFRKLTGKEAEASRFHYLRLKFPVSYQNLSDAGFREDYSMGYHDEPGFRAGTAMSFMFYNIEKESISNLRVFPFQVMDGTLYRYRSLNTGEAGQVISRLLGNCMECGGNFVSIWHNTSLLRSAEWQGWRELFESMLKN